MKGEAKKLDINLLHGQPLSRALLLKPVTVGHKMKFFQIPVEDLCKIAGLILAMYCVRYPYAVPFLRNKMPYSVLKTPKTHIV